MQNLVTTINNLDHTVKANDVLEQRKILISTLYYAMTHTTVKHSLCSLCSLMSCKNGDDIKRCVRKVATNL